MFSDNIQYKFMEPQNIELESGNGTYTRRELIDLIDGKIELTQFDKNPQINKMDKFAGITEVVLNSDELKNTDNLEIGEPSNTLFMYHVTAYEDFTHFEPYTPQYKKLKNSELISLALKMIHKKNNIITDGPTTTAVLHI